MPPVRHIRRAIRRIRQRIQAPVPLPADRSSLVLHDECRKLPNGENFLLFDSGVGDTERLILFETARNYYTLHNIDLLMERSR